MPRGPGAETQAYGVYSQSVKGPDGKRYGQMSNFQSEMMRRHWVDQTKSSSFRER
jgi:hypothetical protein